MFCSSFTPTFFSVLIWQTCYVLMFFQVLFSCIKNMKGLTQSPSSKIKRTKPLEKHKASRDQENCSIEPRITEHRLQVLNEVKQFFRLNSHIIIRSQGVILNDCFPINKWRTIAKIKGTGPCNQAILLHIWNRRIFLCVYFRKVLAFYLNVYF